MTSEELDALPVHTIIQELDRDPALGNHPHPWVKQPHGWQCACDGEAMRFTSEEMVQDTSEKRLFVVWTPA